MPADIETGDIQLQPNKNNDKSNDKNSSNFLCFDCPENNQLSEDENSQTPSQATFEGINNNSICDEDDLGDKEDEFFESNKYENHLFDEEHNVFDENNTFYEKDNENDSCFELNNEFLKIIDSAANDTKLKNTEEDSYNLDTPNENDEKKYFFKNNNIPNDVMILHNIEDFWEANSESEDEEYLDKNSKNPLDQISFEKLKKKIYKDFEVNLIHRYSSALDILASYIKYHVIIYTEASYYCTFKLNLFMVPAILFSTICTIMTSITHNREDMGFIISSMNGFVAFLLAIINYLKLDASAESHKISAYQYSKLKNYIEFSSGEILLFQDPIITNKNFVSEKMKIWEKNNEDAYNDSLIYNNEKKKKIKEYSKLKSQLEKKLIDTIQNKLFEIKKSLKNIEDNNNFILPKHINRRYYNIYNINVFSYIKSVENYKLIILNNLRNVKNEIRFYRTLNKNTLTDDKIEKIRILYKRKNNILTEFLELNKGFMLIDTMFQQEIKNINIRKKYWPIFKLQGFIKMIIKCCCCKVTNINILPVGYKYCTKVGFMDEDGNYLLDKILRCNNVLSND
uniref:Uncharacterized protein n=1 Tax=Florenciella sp. virus SA2 TaxID=3240092 RepID=A0AB39JE18_9VIRU